MAEDEAFDVWMSRVELHLESMVKKSSKEFKPYDYMRDFKKNVSPSVTATRVIKRKYQNSNTGERQ